MPSKKNAHQWWVATLIIISCSSFHCKNKRQAHVKGIWVAQAQGIQREIEGEFLTVNRGDKITTLPNSNTVGLVIARNVLWSEVRNLRKQIQEAGKAATLIVADQRKIGTIELYEELKGTPIKVFVSVGGKLCVSPPDTPEAKCLQRRDKLHVDRAMTRELVREAVTAWNLHDVTVDVPPDLEWADLVRAVDGARTCCFDEKVRVRLK